MIKLYVGNLPFSTDDSQLRALFEPHGEVVSASIVMDRDTGRPRGFGFVEMSNDNEAKAAIEAMNGQSVDGRAIVVNEAKPRESRGGFGGGGGRGGGGGGDITITQDAKTLVISRMVQEAEIKTTYNLDGSPSKNTGMGRGGAPGAEMTSTAKWDGAKLVITQENGPTITYSMDGAWLVVATTRPARDGGPATTTTVYYKKAA